jgi:hypothetical protein
MPTANPNSASPARRPSRKDTRSAILPKNSERRATSHSHSCARSSPKPSPYSVQPPPSRSRTQHAAPAGSHHHRRRHPRAILRSNQHLRKIRTDPRVALPFPGRLRRQGEILHRSHHPPPSHEDQPPRTHPPAAGQPRGQDHDFILQFQIRVYPPLHTGEKKYNSDIYERFLDLFKCLPLCALIDNKYFAVHGGLSPFVKTLSTPAVTQLM